MFTLLGPDCSLIIFSNVKEKWNKRERKRRRENACELQFFFIQPAYRVYNHKPEKNPYSTIKLIVSSPFFPLTGGISTTLHITSKRSIDH